MGRYGEIWGDIGRYREVELGGDALRLLGVRVAARVRVRLGTRARARAGAGAGAGAG